MGAAAAVVWACTAALGAFMFVRTVTGSRTADGRSPSNLPGGLVAGHGFLALATLAAWATAYGYGSERGAWIASAGLLLVVGGGLTLLLLGVGPGRTARFQPGDVPPAEDSIPAAVVVFHGLGAAVTLALVLATNLTM